VGGRDTALIPMSRCLWHLLGTAMGIGSASGLWPRYRPPPRRSDLSGFCSGTAGIAVRNLTELGARLGGKSATDNHPLRLRTSQPLFARNSGYIMRVLLIL
jgi:hypothetical protein